jgi:hypothetical protein
MRKNYFNRYLISFDGLCVEGDSVVLISTSPFFKREWLKAEGFRNKNNKKIPPTPLLEKGGASITKYFFKSLPFWKGPVLLSEYPKGEGFRNVKNVKIPRSTTTPLLRGTSKFEFETLTIKTMKKILLTAALPLEMMALKNTLKKFPQTDFDFEFLIV